MRNLELPGRSPVHAPDGMACTSHPLASQTAIAILRSGGNAMDAAVAACAVQCVVEPGSTGIGGDCFCLYSPEGSTNIIAFNGSGKAPSGATVDWYEAQGITELERHSPHSVTVPGAIDAWAQLIGDHGSLDLKDVLAPAIHYARDGYPISSRVHKDFSGEGEILKLDENAARVFLPGGNVPAVGQMHRQPELAVSLQKIADQGPDAFYRGDIAHDIVEYLQSKGGLHSLEDFAAVKGDYVTPISTEYRGHTVYQCPPNGQGVIALMLLNMMKGLDVDTSAGPITIDRIHHEIEACRAAYRERDAFVADPAYADVPVDQLLSQSHADALRARIDPARAADHHANPDLPRHNDTVYLTVVDKDRNAVSFINTLFFGFGSGLMAPRSGVMLQNRGQGFVLDRNSPNRIEPGKRPLHTIIPGMVAKDDRVVMPYGVMGGQYQAFGHMQFLTRFFDYGLDIQEAMDRPRFMADPFTGEVEMEGTIDAAIQASLQDRGHRIVSPEKPIGGSQAIWIDWNENVLTGGSDPRKDGCAIGY